MTRTQKMIVEIATFIAIISIVMVWACIRAKHRYEKIQQTHQYEECLVAETMNPGSHLCVPPKFLMSSQN